MATVQGVTPVMTAEALARAILGASGTAAGPTTTLKPGTCPPNYLASTVPNPDLGKIYDGSSTGDGYKPTGNENYYIKLPPQLASTTNFVGWRVCVRGGDLPPNTTINATVKAYKKGSPANGFDSFQFSPTLPGLFGNHQMAFFFAPTMTGGRRRRASRRSRGRKGTRRH